MGFEMKPEKEVLELISSKNQCKSNPNSVKKKNKNKNKKMMMTWRRKKIDSPADGITAVRRLFNTCKEVFSNGGPGVIPSEDKIQQLREILGIQFLSVF
jgi:cysteamine dioxygenase